jgi:hypothetical protein
MIFDEVYQLPRPNGATDYNDSSHLAGMLAVTNHHQQVDCENYLIDRIVDRDTPLGNYVRHPAEIQYDFSRDQFIPLACGLIAQGRGCMVQTRFVTGRDILPPSVRGLVRIAHGKNPQLHHRLWLKLEILWHSYIQPLDEPNQIIALCSVYGDEYLNLWTKHNKLWRWSLRRYWSELDGAWRDEKELCEHIIKYVESKIK